jgi:hypothetical protein
MLECRDERVLHEVVRVRCVAREPARETAQEACFRQQLVEGAGT